MQHPRWPKGLIFDLDGVIIHSTPVHIEAWRRYLKRFGLNPTDEEIQRAMLGKHNSDVVRAFFGPGTAPEWIHRHGAEKERLYRQLMAPQLQDHLVPGLREFLVRYQHLPAAVASNAEPANVDFVLDGAGLRAFFRVTLSGHDVPRPKPYPDIYVLAAERLGLPAEACLVFEDSQTGVDAARAAGMRVVGLTTTGAVLHGAELLVGDFTDPRLHEFLARSG